MNSWHDKIQLQQPLRDVSLQTACSSETEARFRERERAAYVRGRQEGERALSEQLVQQRTELNQLQQGVLASLQQAVPQVIRDSENTLIALALEAAQKLVCGIPVSAEMVEATVREALDQVEEATEFSIDLHPDDLALLEKHHSPMLDSQGGAQHMCFRGSSQVSPGGCLVHTRFGVINGCRETKLENLKKTLLS
ncbi:MAG: FliH/SctL family protein [Verrucomicrobiia bacterium]